MSVQQAFEFTMAAAKDPALAARVSAAVNGRNAGEAAVAVAALGKAHGYDFTAAEAIEARAKLFQSAQLSEKDLGAVAGGITGIKDFRWRNPTEETISEETRRLIAELLGPPNGGW